MIFRDYVRREDPENIGDLVRAAGIFKPSEIRVAVELAEECLLRGPVCGYYFAFYPETAAPAGYICYGPVPCAERRFDLYWIAVHPQHRRTGLGKALMKKAEEEIRRMSGTRIYIDTSSRKEYLPARRLYTACGYSSAAELNDFYGLEDNKIIYLKILGNG